MTECNAILEFGGLVTAPDYPKPEHKILETFTVYNYFCLRMECFQSFFGREKGVIKCCPNCNMNDRVMGTFE